MKSIFSASDLKTIDEKGLTKKDVADQIKAFEKGSTPVKLDRPCTMGDGIITIPESEMEHLQNVHDRAAEAGRMTKMVPASGAASRMFKDWFEYYETKGLDGTEKGAAFLEALGRFAFYGDLKKAVSRNGETLEALIGDVKVSEILEYALTSRGLNYAYIPKALIEFHAYPDGSRTALEEHLVEAVSYICDGRRRCKIHFTASKEHRSAIENHIEDIKGRYEKKYGVIFDTSLSVQLSSTDTIAVDPQNNPFRNGDNELVFRPGGHGALLKNLNEIDADIIFLKNIDNIIPDRLKPETTLYKKILGGLLVSLQDEAFGHLNVLSRKDPNEERLSEIIRFCKKRLSIVFPVSFKNLSHKEKIKFIFDKLNRPIRVCGMVKNVGEPGGGPFWTEEKDGTQSMQIVEEAQIDMYSEKQKEIWKSSTHFNPVDLVCGIRNYSGEKFDLEEYTDKNAFLISQKSYEGKTLKALELPGLWNGSMAKWNTVFVEVPLITFNPVKTVEDLTRKEHLN